MDLTMIDVKHEPLPVTSQPTFPAAPFPRKYLLCVINAIEHAEHAIQVLLAAGYDARDIHLIASQDFAQAIEARRRTGFSRAPGSFFRSTNHELTTIYLKEACQGHQFLAIRLTGQEQVQQVHKLLTCNHAHLIEYVDTWTVTHLPPAPEFDQVYNSAGPIEFRRTEEAYKSSLIEAISAFYRLD